jgi:hypothetical protein
VLDTLPEATQYRTLLRGMIGERHEATAGVTLDKGMTVAVVDGLGVVAGRKRVVDARICRHDGIRPQVIDGWNVPITVRELKGLWFATKWASGHDALSFSATHLSAAQRAWALAKATLRSVMLGSSLTRVSDAPHQKRSV